jgi:sn-glycerol 3-phosphate transport system ATP-binding protein
MNLVPGVVRDGVLSVAEARVARVPTPDGPVTVGSRPEHLRVHTTAAEGRVPARVDFTEPLGSHALVTTLIGDTRVVAQAPAQVFLESGTKVWLELPPERTYFFDTETGDARRHRERITL